MFPITPFKVPFLVDRNVQVLRNTLNCTLPVELVFNGEYEMDKGTCDKFEV